MVFVEKSYAVCNFPSDRDSAGNMCGGRAASVKPGGKLGGIGFKRNSFGTPKPNNSYPSFGTSNNRLQPTKRGYDPFGGYQQPFGNNNKPLGY